MAQARDLAALIDITWPCARSFANGPFVLRDGQGGGKRVSAASLATGPWDDADITRAEMAMRAMGQTPLFVIWPDSAPHCALDGALAQRRYEIVDSVVVYHSGIDTILGAAPNMSKTYPHWPPLAIGLEMWQNAGIGPARCAIMHRVQGVKTAILARRDDHAAGVCFVAMAGKWAMLHALEVAPQHRQLGAAQDLVARAAHWAKTHGGVNLALVVTEANLAARALYEKLGMTQVSRYHYRQSRDM